MAEVTRTLESEAAEPATEPGETAPMAPRRETAGRTRSRRRREAYTEAVGSGLYERRTGLHGKYDNVRLYWEDGITRLFLRGPVDRLVQRRVAALSRVRIIDLGCGSGDGFEMLMRLVRKDPGLNEDEVRVLRPEHLGQYTGIDLNDALLGQARRRWQDNPKMEFVSGDLTTGLPVPEGAPPYDIYFTSFGTLSHLGEAHTVRLLVDIVRHAEPGALVVGDWLGRFSYEWQDLWDGDAGREQWMDYVISYLYPPGQRRGRKLAHLDLRLLCREEVERILGRVEAETGRRLVVRELFDRSLLVGRHMDTADYNRHLTPLRRAVNSLHEDDQRTCLETLLIDYNLRPEFPFLNQFFDRLQACWNALVRDTMELCQRFDDAAGELREAPAVPAHYPEPLRRAMGELRRVVQGAGWLRMGDPRANVIEPQLGYALRGLEIHLQEGLGVGHGLVGVFEVQPA